MIYFDNAATSGIKPIKVIKAVNKALKFYSVNPGRSGYKKSIEAAVSVYKIREQIADMFGASPETVAFTLNCTNSINYILKGKLKKGDHIIISDLEHNAVMRPLMTLVKNSGVEFSIAETTNDDEITIKNFENHIKNNTKLIFCTHASNVTGKIMPIKKIGELSHRYNIEFAVDAAQSAGVLPINMEEMNIDYLAIAAHKGLYAPMGIGVLICKKPLDFTIIEGGTGTNSIDMLQPEEAPERYESGTINLPGIFGIGGGIEFLNSYSKNQLYEKEFSLIEYIYSSLKKVKKVKLYTEYPIFNNNVPVLCFNVENANSDTVAAFLAKNNIATRAGLHCAPLAHKKMGTYPNGAVRISVGFFNTLNEGDYLINTIKKM